MAITVVKSRCPQNHPCPAVRACPLKALSQRGFQAPVVDQDACIDCGKCARACPMGALQWTRKEIAGQAAQRRAAG